MHNLYGKKGIKSKIWQCREYKEACVRERTQSLAFNVGMGRKRFPGQFYSKERGGRKEGERREGRERRREGERGMGRNQLVKFRISYFKHLLN